ncbi:MAG TPA: MlaD family protein [Bacteroidia bacterium]|jgi:phospholipid/cholesterol/gamma-HCH transport system substrate-binding protein|nr:MlaD family protein [Bacteroidia bacterium]
MRKNLKIDPEMRKTFWLGLFVTIGLILLITAVYLIGSKKNMFSSTFHVAASFSDVNGLQIGDAVRFRGINIGTVKKITMLNDSALNVVMNLEEEMKPFIKKNAIANIITDGLLGNKIVSIRNGNNQAKSVEENDILKTYPPIDVDDVQRKLKSTNDHLVNITNNLSDITDKINKGKGALGTLITDSVFAKNLKESMRDIKAGTKNLDRESEALKHNFLFKKYFKNENEEKK